MLTNKILDPFKELCELIPDLNDNRAQDNEQWIFTEDPLNWTDRFPRITIKASDINIKESPGQQMPVSTQNTYSFTYNLKITYYVKRMDDFVCPDGVRRKGKLLTEFMGLNVITPTILRNKELICQKYDWLETVNLNNISEIIDVNKYAVSQEFMLSVNAVFTDMIPISNDSYIKTININETIEDQ